MISSLIIFPLLHNSWHQMRNAKLLRIVEAALAYRAVENNRRSLQSPEYLSSFSCLLFVSPSSRFGQLQTRFSSFHHPRIWLFLPPDELRRYPLHIAATHPNLFLLIFSRKIGFGPTWKCNITILSTNYKNVVFFMQIIYYINTLVACRLPVICNATSLFNRREEFLNVHGILECPYMNNFCISPLSFRNSSTTCFFRPCLKST